MFYVVQFCVECRGGKQFKKIQQMGFQLLLYLKTYFIKTLLVRIYEVIGCTRNYIFMSIIHHYLVLDFLLVTLPTRPIICL